MTVKRKSETRNPVTYWWNEFLFVKPFVIETDQSPEEAANRLKMLRHERAGFWYPKGCTVSVNDVLSPLEDAITFDIRRKRYNKRSPYTTAKAEGVVVQDGGTGITVVRGQVKFGWWYYANMLLMPLPTLFFFSVWGRSNPFANSPIPLIFLAVITVIIGMQWWQMFTDRNGLIRDIAAVLDSRKEKLS